MALALALPLLSAAGCGELRPRPGRASASTAVTDTLAATPMEIQGEGHHSPLADRTVRTAGVVTAVTSRGFFVQDPTGDGWKATSDGLFVVPEETVGRTPDPGDRIRLVGRVEEHRPGGARGAGLTVTRLVAEEVEVLARRVPLPSPVLLGEGGRPPPRSHVLDPAELPVDLSDPAEARSNPFDPDRDAIDFFESLEGMRVTVSRPVAVGPLRRFGEAGEIYVLPDGGSRASGDGLRTARGGLRLLPHPADRGGPNPDRVQLHLSPGLHPRPFPPVTVGDRLGDATGVLGYGFGNFELLVTTPLRVERPSGLKPEATSLRGDREAVTVASYNVGGLNALPVTRPRLERVGGQIARELGAPDVVALQEIQDDGGPVGGAANRRTGAGATLEALGEAVLRCGGPTYAFAEIPPAPNSSGGVPGGNIRNAFLYRPDRVEMVELRALTAAELVRVGAPDADAFRASRTPLAATFRFGETTLTIVNVHLTSRAGSTPVFGAVHPTVIRGEREREAQLLALHAWVAHRLGSEEDARIVVAGDFNSFEFTDDLRLLLPTGRRRRPLLRNLLPGVPVEERYTFIFEGNAQALDHLFVTRSLVEGARLDVVHLNVDFPPMDGTSVGRARTGEPGASGASSPYRAASDHEPMVARLLPRP